MSARRTVAIAYGDPSDVNSFVIIGGDSTDFFLHDWSQSELYADLMYSITFSVRGNGSTEALRAADFESNLDYLDLLNAYSRDLTVASGVEKEWDDAIVAIVFGSPDVVQVQRSSGATFSASDVGKLIVVKGETLRVVSYVSANSVNCLGTAGSIRGIETDLTGAPVKLLKTIDATVESTRTRGYRARPSVSPIGSESDHKSRRTYQLQIRFTRPASDTRDNGRLLANYTIEQGVDDIRTVMFTGIYTALGATGALAVYEANFGTWKTSVLSGLGGTFSQQGSTRVEVDDELALVKFVATYVELNERETVGDFDSSVLADQSLSITRDHTYSIGVVDSIPPARLYVRYNTKVSKSVTTDDYLTDLYKNTVRGHILAQIRAKNDNAEFIIEREIVTPNTARNSLAVYLELELVDPGASTLLQYSRSVEYSVQSRKADSEYWDVNLRHKFASFTPSEVIVAAVTVTETRRNVQPDIIYTAQDLSLGDASVTAIGENLMPTDTGSIFQAPGSPPVPDTQKGLALGWNWRGHDLQVQEVIRGGRNDFYGAAPGAIEGDTVYTATLVSTWRWGEETTLGNPNVSDPVEGQFITPAASPNIVGVLPALEILE